VGAGPSRVMVSTPPQRDQALLSTQHARRRHMARWGPHAQLAVRSPLSCPTNFAAACSVVHIKDPYHSLAINVQLPSLNLHDAVTHATAVAAPSVHLWILTAAGLMAMHFYACTVLHEATYVASCNYLQLNLCRCTNPQQRGLQCHACFCAFIQFKRLPTKQQPTAQNFLMHAHKQTCARLRAYLRATDCRHLMRHHQRKCQLMMKLCC
jgi:hypothetical protein